MKIVLLLFLLTALVSLSHTQSPKPSEFKLVFNYEVVEILKTSYIKPLVENKLQNYQIPKPLEFNNTYLRASINDMVLLTLDLDWDNTHFLTPASDEGNLTAVQIRNLNVSIEFDAIFSLFNITYTGDNNIITIEGIDLDLIIGFGFSPVDQASYLYIESSQVSIQNVKTQFSYQIENFIMVLVERLGLKLPQILTKVIDLTIHYVNKTLPAKTSAGFGVTILDLLNIHLSLADLPFIFDSNHDAWQELSINLEITDIVTNKTAPPAMSDVIPNYLDGLEPIQMFVSANMVSQILWAAFDSGKIDLVISEANLTNLSLPLRLNTTDLTILFPQLCLDYGPGKGVYLKFTKAGDFPLASIVDGRLLAEVPILMDLYVDLDSSHYPQQGLANCSDCVSAATINISALASLDIYRVNSTNIGVKILDVILYNVQTISGDVDEASLQTALNNFMIPLANQINAQLEPGIRNPLIGKLGLGINDTNIQFGSDFIFFGLSIQSLSNQTQTLIY